MATAAPSSPGSSSGSLSGSLSGSPPGSSSPGAPAGRDGVAPVVHCRGVAHAWGASPSLVDVNLALVPGRITGFLGRNGAGKSTTMRVLAGVIEPDAGVVTVGGVAAHRPAARARVGFAPEEPALASGLTVVEQLRFAGRLRGLRGRPLEDGVAAVIDSLDLTDVKMRLCGALSKGTRQRVGTAMALLGAPAVLLLDEPGAGLDPTQASRLRALLLDRRAQGAAILLSSHVVAELEAVVDDVVVIAGGRTVFAGPRSALAEAVIAAAGSAGTDPAGTAAAGSDATAIPAALGANVAVADTGAAR
jgi:ABC-2 type transport system ATP-binding protein